MVILKSKTIAPVIITGIIISSLIAAISISASSYTVNATRDLPDSVSPRSYFNITLNFTAPADKFNAIGIHEEAPEGWNVTVNNKWCSPNADIANKADKNISEYVWYGPYDANTSFTVVYKFEVPSDVKAGSYAFNGTVEYYIGSDGPYEETTGGDKEVAIGISVSVFDTGLGTYPSISGTHNGIIIPNKTIIANKLYTYPHVGTGGHTEYARIWGNGVDACGTWKGYTNDWHNITLNETITLEPGKTYNYTIRTGSYPQIIHVKRKDVTGGTIICSQFTDANGKEYTDWIPAIILE